MAMGERHAVTAERARTWTTDLVSVGLDRCDGWVGSPCVVHVDGATIDWESLKCLVAAYGIVFPVDRVDVAQVSTWQDKAMIAYTVRYASPWMGSEPRRATAFLRLADDRIAEIWLIDDWLAWLAHHGVS